jgi:SAM-dependent methyltransferase
MTFMTQVRKTLKQSSWVQAMRRALREPRFESSDQYWKARYRRHRNSGAGSYGRLAEFKAEVLNEFVREHRVESVIEWGCGDGNQQALAHYPRYIGVDISQDAIKWCNQRFKEDSSKQFLVNSRAERLGVKADLALSLDVLYHLVEDPVFDSYMRSLLRSAERFIGIYSSDEDRPGHMAHVRHRSFSRWMEKNAPDWRHIGFVANRYPYDPANPDETSWANFGFFQRA